jgi:hypothetical protein
MSLIVSLYAAILFFILTPGVLLRLPKNGGKLTVAAVHALVFALVFHFTNKLVWRLGASMEGMANLSPAQV